MAVAILVAESPCAAQIRDDALAAARRFVEASDNYLHHSRLSAGMKGYGLTVMSGTKPARFDVEIVSVVSNWGPHQDAILARLSGLNLEKTMVVQGMSGSPVYVRLPGETHDRLIGAVAFGWRGQNEPICGIQPITQMLAIRGVLPGSASPTTQPAPRSGSDKSGPTTASQKYLDAVLNPRKLDFAGMDLSSSPRPSQNCRDAEGNMELAPLMTPLMMSGSSPRTVRAISRYLAPRGIMPLQGGGAAPGSRPETQAPLVPGSAVSIPLVTGDADWSASGTVTDVIGENILAFGHRFYGWGDMALPMGGASVHTIISSRQMSFKLSSSLAPTGVLYRDELVGVAGRVGPSAKKVSMIPMTVELTWKGDNRKQVYRYNVCRHRLLTAMFVSALVRDAAWGWRSLPPFHTVRHRVEVDFGEFGLYRAENVSSDRDVMWAASDVSRPVAAMLNNPLGPPLAVKSISVKISVEPQAQNLRHPRNRLDGYFYADAL
ncbi:MAG: hypothetical protein J7M14_06805, partial [Planctomycetes bacterium]|nr:hypothetical protein [Planctomycetota bacterium]